MISSMKNKSVFSHACFLLVFFIIWPSIYSCSERVLESRATLNKPLTSIGELHNQGILNYISVIGTKQIGKVPFTTARQVIVDVVNEMVEEYKLDPIPEQLIDNTFAKMIELKSEGIVDFWQPESININDVMDRAIAKGIISKDKADKYLRQHSYLQQQISNASKIENILCSPPDITLEDPATDIMYSSAALWMVEMDEYVIEHPELKSWWDYWKKKIYTAFLLTTDLLGALLLVEGGPASSLIGGYLASLAFTMAFDMP